NIGLIHFNRGDYELALELYEKSLAIQEELGDKSGIAGSCYNIGLIHYERGEYGTALELFTRSRDIYTQLGLAKNVAQAEEMIEAVLQRMEAKKL
ncbi:MAG: tetratricopeptide repeat protein, partial [Planctomycetes bacterium]|nr:tetratricopeptide repeat protein [Planctomycetota bacterium]